MLRIVGFLCTILFVSVFAQTDSSDAALPSSSTVSATENLSTGDDIAVVKSILDQTGITDRTAEEASIIENGRVVSLDLSNKNVATDGITILPADIGKLTALRTLLCKNNAVAIIPLELSKCTQLTKVDFNSNRIVEIPLQFGQLMNLVEIDLRYNKIESIPYTIGNFKQLEVLRLWGNLLVSLPAHITILPALRELYLRDNRLTSLPSDIVKMKSLKYIDLAGNKLCDADATLDVWLKAKDKSYKQTQKCW